MRKRNCQGRFAVLPQREPFPTPKSFSPPPAPARPRPPKTDGQTDQVGKEMRRGEESSTARPWKLLLIDGSRSRSFSLLLLIVDVLRDAEDGEDWTNEVEEQTTEKKQHDDDDEIAGRGHFQRRPVHVHVPSAPSGARARGGGVNCSLGRHGLFKRVGTRPRPAGRQGGRQAGRQAGEMRMR